MVAPTLGGRTLPINDWEGDDFTPGAGGEYVTCRDTAVGRAVAWATNGRIDHDGRVYRAAIRPPAPLGITIAQAADAVRAVAHLDLVAPEGWDLARVESWLGEGRGLIVDGWYDRLPPEFRYQASAHFTHSIFAAVISATTGPGAWRVWDPLNPDRAGRGRWIPGAAMAAFVASLRYQVSYVPLQPLKGLSIGHV